MKHLGISGGGTKISGLFGAAEVILTEKNYRPDIISGISAGAVLALPLAMGKFEEIKKIVLNLQLKTFFSVLPVSPNGKIRMGNALWRLLRGKHSLGEQKNLEKRLREMISESEFEEYKNNDEYPAAIVGSVDFCTGRRVFVNLKDVSYEDFPRFVNGSASIPIFTEAIEIDKPFTDFEGTKFTDRVFLFDGGVRDHSPTHKVICCQNLGITETCTIFSRPEDYNILFPDYFPKNIIKVLERYVDISNTEVSKNDEALEINYIKTEQLVNHGIFFLPKVMESLYDVDKGRLKKLYEEGKKVVQKNWKADLTPA